MEAAVRARKVGGSLIVTLPKGIVDEQGIKEGELIRLKIEKIKKDYFGALRGIGSFRKEDKLDVHE